MTKKLTKSLRELNKQKSDKLNLISGVLGITINGLNTVEVPNRDGYVFVRLRGSMSELIQAYNGAVSPIYGLPILVTYENNRYAIYGRDTEKYGNWGESSYLPLHGEQHSFAPELGLGGDVSWIYSRQFIPLSAIPSGSAGAGNVIVNSHVYLDPIDSAWKFIGDEGTPNVLGLKPTGSSARLLLLCWDVLAQDPIFITGSFFPNTITGTSSIVPFIPSIANNRLIPISAIRLVSGTDVIGWDNIYDVRQFSVATTPPFMGGIMIQDEGVNVGTGSVLNFVGDLIQASSSGGDTIRIFVSGTPVTIFNEGVSQGKVSTLDFVGDLVNASVFGDTATIRITGSTGGGSINTGTLDARYLKLDASNDPITGLLDINAVLRVNSNDARVVNGGVDVQTNAFLGGYFQMNHGEAYPMDIEQWVTGSSTIGNPILYLLRRGRSAGMNPVFAEDAIVVETNDFSGSTTEGLIRYDLNGTTRTHINPSAAGTGTAVHFDTENFMLTAGKLLLLSHQGTPQFFVNSSGTAFSNSVELVKDAPRDGNQYKRKDGGWVVAGSDVVQATNVNGFLAQDEGVPLGTGTTLNFVGDNISASISGSVVRVYVTGSSSGNSDISVRSYLTANFAASGSNAFVALPFDQDQYDTDSIHSVTGSDFVKSKFTCQTPGKYLLIGGAEFASNGTGQRGCQIRVNDRDVGFVFIPAAANIGHRLQASSIYPLLAGDYVQFGVAQSSGGNLNIITGSSTWFSMQRIA